MIKNIAALMLIVLLTSSCMIYHVNSVDTSEEYFAPKSPEEIVFVNLDDLEGNYEIIGTVIVNGERKQRNLNDVLAKMRREAAILGGDAIGNIQSDATGSWKRLPVQQTLGNAYVRSNYTASVIVFK